MSTYAPGFLSNPDFMSTYGFGRAAEMAVWEIWRMLFRSMRMASSVVAMFAGADWGERDERNCGRRKAMQKRTGRDKQNELSREEEEVPEREGSKARGSMGQGGTRHRREKRELLAVLLETGRVRVHGQDVVSQSAREMSGRAYRTRSVLRRSSKEIAFASSRKALDARRITPQLCTISCCVRSSSIWLNLPI